MEFRVLGTLEVLDNGGHPVELRGSKLRTLLAALVLRAGQPVSADRLADLLWGESPPSGSANALQAQVSKLRKLLADVPLEGRDGGYVLAIDPQQIDAERFTQLAKAGHELLTAGSHAEAATRCATRLRCGVDPRWRTSPSRSSPSHSAHGSRRCDSAAIEDRVDADLADGHHEAVAAELEGLVREHPLRERLWGQLMLALYRCDRQSDSLRAFQRARDLLADELGLDPGPGAARARATGALARRRAGRPGHRACRARAAGPLEHPSGAEHVRRPRSRHRPHRRAAADPPAGLHHRARWHRQDPNRHRDRSCTLVGVWRDGTWLVELGVEAGERAVTAAFHRTFGPRLGHTGGDEAIDWLTTGLATTELLIVLDNCEHVLAEAAAVASTIVRSCPGVSILATSREPLGVSGERVRVLEPLELDDAMQLFASRAADSDSEFVLDDDSSPSVATICTNVDRLPLAIELTAARTRAFSAQQLAELLDHRFGIVSTANSGRPKRQQTMHAAVDWSFDLLFDDEKRLLTRLSVFAGGFTLDAASKVCSDEHVDRRRHRGAASPGSSTSHWWRPSAGRAARPASVCCDPSPSTPLDVSTRPARPPRFARVTPDGSSTSRPGSRPVCAVRTDCSGHAWATPNCPTSLARPTGDSATVIPPTRCRSESTSAGTPS